MKTNIYKFLGFLLALLTCSSLIANNIQVSNVKLTRQNTSAGTNHANNYTLVQFDLSWENSWRTSSAPNNWDAAWVFVKYRAGSSAWQHAWLNDTGHSGGSGTSATIDAGLRTPGSAFNATTNPCIGAFIYRSADGVGTFSISNAQLRWNYGANGVADNATVEIKVFVIEMVYVPQGSFAVGSGGTESGSFTNGSWTSGATIALSISSEDALSIHPSSGNLWGTSSDGSNGIGNIGNLSAEFPKGYAAFYCMKYEISQQQYVDFLNTLTQTQANNRKDNTGLSNRNAITGTTVGGYATTNPYIASNYRSWMDGAAYSDWAGLRPMTELEFEKACRGPVAPVANEYAWGTATVAGSNYTLNNSGQFNESIETSYSTTAGNASYSITDGNIIKGPLRVGIFAGHASNTGRITSGASYWGIMELSGNLWERPVTVGNNDGRAFTGVHGDGALSSNGHANEINWPGLTNGEVTEAEGSGIRGGVWYYDAPIMAVSDRWLAAFTYRERFNPAGFRAVRRVP
jgi:formylglycine-generating enzyme required for sulfatase activity